LNIIKDGNYTGLRAGCGVCIRVCPEGALSLVRRPAGEVLPPPVSEADWQAQRAAARGLDMAEVM